MDSEVRDAVDWYIGVAINRLDGSQDDIGPFPRMGAEEVVEEYVDACLDVIRYMHSQYSMGAYSVLWHRKVSSEEIAKMYDGYNDILDILTENGLIKRSCTSHGDLYGFTDLGEKLALADFQNKLTFV